MTRLAIVGASVRAAAQSALRAGFDVVGADLFADADLDGVCPITKIESYPDALADWLAAQQVDAWMYTGALENCPELVDRMAQIAPLWGVSGEPLRRCRDPIRLMRDCFDADLGFPGTFRARAIQNRNRASIDTAFGRFAKTYRHSNGTGVWRLHNAEDWQRALDADAFVQIDLLPSDPYSAIFAVSDSEANLLGMTQQMIGDDFCYRGSTGPCKTDARQDEQLASLGEMLRTRINLRGLIGVDLVQYRESVTDYLAVIEINPRYTASVEVLERATGRSAIAAHHAVFAHGTARRGEAIADWGPATSTCGKRIVYATKELTITAELDAWLEAEQNKARLADRPRRGETIEAGQPICTLFDSGTDLKSLERSLSERAGAISQFP